MDRITGLTVFAKVVESGGFSAASRKLNMSTTMVSKHVQVLEDRLGARLFNRTTRKVSLTEVGQDYHRRVVQILSDLEQADETASALQSTPKGVLRIYTSTTIIPFVAPVVTEYLGLYPQAKVDLTMGERQVDLIDEGFDIAVQLASPVDSSLIVRNLATWRHVACASPAYLAERGTPCTPSELQGHNCFRHVLYPYHHEWHFKDRLGAPVVAQVGGNLVTNSGEMMLIAALSGRGIMLCPSFLVAEDIRQGRLVQLLADMIPVDFTLNAVYPHRHNVSAKVRSFVDLLASHSAEYHRLLESAD